MAHKKFFVLKVGRNLVEVADIGIHLLIKWITLIHNKCKNILYSLVACCIVEYFNSFFLRNSIFVSSIKDVENLNENCNISNQFYHKFCTQTWHKWFSIIDSVHLYL